MVPEYTTLTLFGTLAVLLPTYYVCSGFLSGKRHLCTTFNAVLIGYVPFVGFSTIAFANQLGAVQRPYALYDSADVYRMIISVLVFSVCFVFTYQQFRTPRNIVEHLAFKPRFTPWQPVIIAILGFCVACLCMMPRYGITIPVISNVLLRCLTASIIFASLFSFASWWGDRSNLFAFLLFAFIFLSCVVMAIMIGSGRRGFIGVLLSLVMYGYWNSFRTINRGKLLRIAAISLVLIFVILNAYGSIRHARYFRAESGRSFANAIEALRRLPSQIVSANFFDGQLVSDIGQNATNCSLYSIHLSDTLKRRDRSTKLEYPSYFHTIAYVVSNPIPRVFWNDKPLALGYMLPKKRSRGAIVTWGPGLAGHFYHEGGIIMAIFYGLLTGVFLKCIDQALYASADNLFVMGLVSAMTPQLMMMPRGDIAIAWLNIIFCLIVFYAVRYVITRAYGRSLPSLQQQYWHGTGARV